jgi:F420-0:gamma-glutamyl ligase
LNFEFEKEPTPSEISTMLHLYPSSSYDDIIFYLKTYPSVHDDDDLLVLAGSSVQDAEQRVEITTLKPLPPKQKLGKQLRLSAQFNENVTETQNQPESFTTTARLVLHTKQNFFSPSWGAIFPG